MDGEIDRRVAEEGVGRMGRKATVWVSVCGLYMTYLGGDEGSSQ